MFHKLANGPIQMTVAEVRSGYDERLQEERVHFVSTDGVAVDLSVTTAERQLGRLNLTFDQCVGKTLDFSQTKKDGRTYNNINLVGGGLQPSGGFGAGGSRPAGGLAPSRPAGTGSPVGSLNGGAMTRAMAPASVSTITPAELTARYGECVDAAVATVAQTCERLGIPFDGATLQAAAATIFIERNRRNI
jgi:hypothetical protein